MIFQQTSKPEKVVSGSIPRNSVPSVVCDMRSNVVFLAKRQLSAAFGLLLAAFIFGNCSLFAAPITFTAGTVNVTG